MRDYLEEASEDVSPRRAAAVAGLIVLGLVFISILRPSIRGTIELIVGIVLVVMLHELGHFITAKRAGMKVTEFFLGFGPRIWSIKRGETEYGIKAIPAGGYNRIIGMNNMEDVDPADEARTYRRAPFKDRIVVVLAGVTVNLVLAFLLFFVVIVGQGLPSATSTLDRISDKTPAASAGFEPGDRIVTIDGRHVSTWGQITDAIEPNAGRALTFGVVRHGQPVTLTATLTTSPRDNSIGFLGVSPDVGFKEYGVLAAVPRSFGLMGSAVKQEAGFFQHLLSPTGVKQYSKNFTTSSASSSSAAQDARPVSLVGIVDRGGELIGNNIWALLAVLALINLVLALFNLIPLLPFDGGHAAIAIYEAIASKVRGRRVYADFRKLIPASVVVLALFLTLGLSATFLDIRRVITGS
ncbi:MAG TPA: M50 family metallopeptidase [Acidimicrobiia bacterium]|nr:M50 family metallopeptidase [Acidimicrobiia bacterium]